MIRLLSKQVLSDGEIGKVLEQANIAASERGIDLNTADTEQIARWANSVAIMREFLDAVIEGKAAVYVANGEILFHRDGEAEPKRAMPWVVRRLKQYNVNEVNRVALRFVSGQLMACNDLTDARHVAVRKRELEDLMKVVGMYDDMIHGKYTPPTERFRRLIYWAIDFLMLDAEQGPDEDLRERLFCAVAFVAMESDRAANGHVHPAAQSAVSMQLVAPESVAV